MKKFSFTMLAVSILIGTTASTSFAGDHRGHHDKHKRFEAMDTNKDGNISKAEHQAWGQQKFQKIDANGDEMISKEERETFQKERYKKKLQQRLERLESAE